MIITELTQQFKNKKKRHFEYIEKPFFLWILFTELWNKWNVYWNWLGDFYLNLFNFFIKNTFLAVNEKKCERQYCLNGDTVWREVSTSGEFVWGVLIEDFNLSALWEWILLNFPGLNERWKLKNKDQVNVFLEKYCHMKRRKLSVLGHFLKKIHINLIFVIIFQHLWTNHEVWL